MRIKQDEHYEGEDWWNWSVWLEGPPAELQHVAKVVWRLHPTFSEPVREQKNRADNFRLRTAGWGTFRVHADVHMDDGSVRKLHHDLQLHYPDGHETEN